MSSFAVGNLIRKEHRQWVEEHMEKDSYLLDLNDLWLCYLTSRDNDIMWSPGPDGKRKIPQSVAAISEKAPVFYLQHPEDHGWMYFAIHKGEVAGSLEIDYEGQEVRGENVFESLALFGFGDDAMGQLREKIHLDTTDMEEQFIMVELLNSALSTDINFISYEYISDNEALYQNIIAKK